MGRCSLLMMFPRHRKLGWGGGQRRKLCRCRGNRAVLLFGGGHVITESCYVYYSSLPFLPLPSSPEKRIWEVEAACIHTHAHTGDNVWQYYLPIFICLLHPPTHTLPVSLTPPPPSLRLPPPGIDKNQPPTPIFLSCPSGTDG